MEIPLIESRISQVSRDKGISLIKVYGSFDHKVIVECVGTITALQIPLMVIDRRGVSIMSALFANRRVTHLRFDDASSRYGNYWRLIVENEVLFGVSDGIQDITRRSGMVRRIRFIYGKSILGFRKSTVF
jgi:hypothetical protein